MSALDPAIIGVGMTPFGKHKDVSMASLGGQAVAAALADAGLEPADIDMAFVANAMSGVVTGHSSAVGQSILRRAGFIGIPVFNIDNACAGSASALALAIQAIQSGSADTVLVLGVEKLVTDDKSRAYAALNGAADPDFVKESGIDPLRESVFVAAVYPQRLNAYQEKYGLTAETLARISVKNRNHAVLNPFAQYRTPMSLEDVLAARPIVGPLTALMCAPIGDGAAALIVTRRDKVRDKRRSVWVRSCAIGMGGTINGEPSLRRVARKAYDQAGLTPADVNLAEVHDSIAFNELLAYEELGFCGHGRGADLVAQGATSIGGRLPVNVSGGLESRGHPVAATGAAQIFELVTQLRGEAGERQVADARIAIAENVGGHALDDTAALSITILASD